MTTSVDVAMLLLDLAARDDESITHLKLQKLLYYCQAYSLALLERPLFDEPIEAWEHGPVARRAYQRFNRFRGRPIPATEFVAIELGEQDQAIIREVYLRFGQFTASALRGRTHREPPYIEAIKSGELNAELRRDSMAAVTMGQIETGLEPEVISVPDQFDDGLSDAEFWEEVDRQSRAALANA